MSAVPCSSKKRVLELISQVAARHMQGTDESGIFESFLAREKLGSTGIGNGIALPHGRLDNSEKPVAVLVQCETPIEFDAIDNKPVDLLFALLVPENDCKKHLATLAAVAEKLSDKQTLRQLRQARTDEELYNILTNTESVS